MILDEAQNSWQLIQNSWNELEEDIEIDLEKVQAHEPQEDPKLAGITIEQVNVNAYLGVPFLMDEVQLRLKR